MKKWLLGNPENALKDSYIWSMIASAINAAESIIILMIATRTVGIGEAGVFTISFTVANLMMCVGKYGVRNYQITDARNEYSFSDYFKVRIVTLGAMLCGTGLYLVYEGVINHYGTDKALIVFLVAAIYGVEAYEDVFVSGLQFRGRLDIGTRMFSIRWVITLLVWSTGLVVFRSAVISTAMALLIDLLLVVVLTRMIETEVGRNNDTASWINIFGILKKCLPLCIAAFLAIYLPNAARYAIDACLTDEIQAYYGFIAMPVFVIDLVSAIIFQPLLVKMSQEWNCRKYNGFISRILKLCVVILLITGICLAGAYFLGIPVLSWMYGVDLSPYKLEFMLLLVGGGALGFIGLFTSVLTIIRRQKYLMGAYVAVSLVAMLSLNEIVIRKGILGAAMANMVFLIGLSLILSVGTIFFIYRCKHKSA